MTSAGFYKLENDILLYSPTTVESLSYYLRAELYETYNYPVDGWYWFPDQESAMVYFNITL